MQNTFKTLLCDGLSHPRFYGDVIYKLRKILCHSDFHDLFMKKIKAFKKRGYDPLILQRSACLVVDPFTVGRYAFLFNCTTTGRQ